MTTDVLTFTISLITQTEQLSDKITLYNNQATLFCQTPGLYNYAYSRMGIMLQWFAWFWPVGLLQLNLFDTPNIRKIS